MPSGYMPLIVLNEFHQDTPSSLLHRFPSSSFNHCHPRATHNPKKLLFHSSATILMLVHLLSIGSTPANAAITVRRHFGQYSSENNALSSPRDSIEESRDEPTDEQKDENIETHCWIRVERRVGEVFEENGTCFRLSPGVYACQSKTFVDPFNPYCMFRK